MHSYVKHAILQTVPTIPKVLVFMPIIPAIIGIQRHKEILLLYAFECPKIIMLT